MTDISNLTLKPKLTIKQRRFLKALIRTFSPTEAAMQTYNCKDRLVARVIASQLLTKLNINWQELLNKMGLDDAQDVTDLIRLRSAKRAINASIYVDKDGKIVQDYESSGAIEVDDNQTQLKALELTLKLKGYLKDKLEHSGTIHSVVKMENVTVGSRLMEYNIGN
jgi:phage terminase small subunit